jgi:arylsulfatase A-like enzyme
VDDGGVRSSAFRPATPVLPLACLLLAVGPLLATCSRAPRDERPNILLIAVDTLRADRLGCYGGVRPISPTIDRLASEGTLFEEVRAHAPQTLPSFCSLLTGTLPTTHGVRANGVFALEESAVTLAEILAQQGYRTGAVVSGFPLDARFGIDQGFGTYLDEMTSNQRPRWVGFSRLLFEKPASEVTAQASAWLAGGDDRPFFLLVHYFDTHAPHEPPPETANVSPEPYDGEIAAIDASLADLLAALPTDDGARPVLVAFTADHGECLGEERRTGHQRYTTEGALRIPLVLRWPGVVPAGARVSGPVRSIDVLPTLLELAGQAIPPTVEGTSLVTALASGRAEVPLTYFETLYGKLEAPSGVSRQGATDGRWKLVVQTREALRDAPATKEYELYDLAADPLETRNLFDRESNLPVELRTLLDARLADGAGRHARVLSPDDAIVERLKALGYF